MKVRAQKVNI